MRKLKLISGKECIKILCKHFDFHIMRRKGSHVYLSKSSPSGTIGTVVPYHDEFRIGTLKGILEMAQIPEEEFVKFL